LDDEGGTTFVVGVGEVGVEEGMGVAKFVFENLPFDCAPVGFLEGDNAVTLDKHGEGFPLGTVVLLLYFVGAEKTVSVPGASAKLMEVAWEEA
jgi:hypothetical protein